MQHYLKLIALRILPGCAPQIKKCLAENTFYYLCNDYTISDDGKPSNAQVNISNLLLIPFLASMTMMSLLLTYKLLLA